MLNYEKKLHFDEHYKKLQSLKGPQKIGALLWGEAGFVLGYLLLKYALQFLPDVSPWSHAEVWFTFYSIPFSKYDGPYILFGLAANCYGSLRLAKITAQNHSVKNEKSGVPAKLLTDGCYAGVRHPMYGAFLILHASLLLSLRSLIGMLLALAVVGFQYLNARWEENRELRPLFAEEYERYAGAVRRVLLRKGEVLVLTAAVLLSLAGLVSNL